MTRCLVSSMQTMFPFLPELRLCEVSVDEEENGSSRSHIVHSGQMVSDVQASLSAATFLVSMSGLGAAPLWADTGRDTSVILSVCVSRALDPHCPGYGRHMGYET